MRIYTVTDVVYSKGGFKSKYDQILVRFQRKTLVTKIVILIYICEPLQGVER